MGMVQRTRPAATGRAHSAEGVGTEYTMGKFTPRTGLQIWCGVCPIDVDEEAGYLCAFSSPKGLYD